MVHLTQPVNCCTARSVSHLGGPIPADITGDELTGASLPALEVLTQMRAQIKEMEPGGRLGNMSAMAIVEAFTVSSQVNEEALLERIGFTRVFGPISKERYGAADLSLWAITGAEYHNGVEREYKREVERLKKSSAPAPKPATKPKRRIGTPVRALRR